MEEQEDEEEKEKPDYFYRLICLVFELGTEVLRKLFLKDKPQSQTVKELLSSKADVLNDLKKKKVFNDLYLGMINAASPDVSRFDISLLYILISNLTNIQSPNGGWYITVPIPSDQSAGAQLMNLRRIRNEAIAHWPEGKMKKSDFEKYWNEAKDILIELAGEVSQADKDSVEEKINKINEKTLVGDMGNKLETLLAEPDRNFEKIISIVEDVSKKNDQQSKVLEDIKSSVQTNTDQLKTLTDQIRQSPGTSLGTENDQQSKVLEDIKSSVQTNTDQLKTLTDQIRQSPGTSLGTENDQQSKVLEDIKSSIQTNTDQVKTLTDQIRQSPGTSLGTENDQQSKVLEDIKCSVQTNTDQLKTLTDQIRQNPATSLGTESSLPEMIYTRTNKRVAGKPVAKKPGPKRVKKESKYFVAKTKLRTEIMDHYKETGCSTTAVPALMDGEEVNIDEIFVMPSMRVRKNMATGRESSNNMPWSSEVITTIHELYQKDGHSIRRVCISGDAGQGKTTLCRKIVSTWCKVHSNIENVPDTEHQFLKSFDLLFYLPLRNNKLSDVIEMIKTDIVRKASHNALKEFLEKESEKCLIILDGLDEWLPSENCKHKVPYIDPKEKFTVLITSRPWKLEVLRPTMSEIGQEVELNWIENDKLIEALVNLLNKKYAKKRNWKHFKYTADNEVTETELDELSDELSDKLSETELDELSETYKKLEHLAEIPIILTQMVCMWYDDEELGNTRVEIYSKMVDYLFHVAHKRHQEMIDSAWMRPQRSTNTQLINVFKDFKYLEMYSEILLKLSDLAFHTLYNKEKENSLVFPHSETEIYKLTENDVKLCLKFGILSQTKRRSKASSYTKSISFLHKTFQEFLAAIYIAYGGKDGSFNEMLDTLKSLYDVFEISQVLIFLSGLRPNLIGDMSRHIAQLTDKDERVLQYRNFVRDEHKNIIVGLQDIIYNCIVEVPEHRMLDTKVELQDVYLQKDDKVKKMIPYLNLDNVKSWDQIWDVHSEDWTKLDDLQVVKLGICIASQKDIDHVTSTLESFASSLTCLRFYFFSTLKTVFLVNIDILLTAFKKVRHLTCVEFNCVALIHSDIEYLGTTLSQSTQLKEIRLVRIRCTTCQKGQCNYRIDLSHHKQLQYVRMWYLDGDIVLSTEVPVERCEIFDVKCVVSILDRLKSSTNLYKLNVYMFDQRFHTNSITSSTTTVQDAEREVHPTPLCVSKVLTDVIPTLKNLRLLWLWDINFKQDILRLSPEMTRLENVLIYRSTMTLQCLQGFIDSLPLTQFDVIMHKVSICPQEDTSTALKYVTDRHQLSTILQLGHNTEVRSLEFGLTNRPSH